MKKTTVTRIFLAVLSLALVISAVFAVSAFAEEEAVADDGNDGIVVANALKSLCRFLAVNLSDCDLISVGLLVRHNEIVADLDVSAVFFIQCVAQAQKCIGDCRRGLVGADELILGRAALCDVDGRRFGSLCFNYFGFCCNFALSAVAG